MKTKTKKIKLNVTSVKKLNVEALNKVVGGLIQTTGSACYPYTSY